MGIQAMAEMSMDIDEDDSPAVDSELEEIALAGKSTINIVQVRSMISLVVAKGIFNRSSFPSSNHLTILVAKVNSRWLLHPHLNLSRSASSGKPPNLCLASWEEARNPNPSQSRAYSVRQLLLRR